MTTSQILRDKLVLAVNEEEDVLEIIEEEFSFETANVTLHAATTFENARQYLGFVHLRSSTPRHLGESGIRSFGDRSQR